MFISPWVRKLKEPAPLPLKDMPVVVDVVIPILSAAAKPRTNSGVLTFNRLLIAIVFPLVEASKATLPALVAERVIGPLLESEKIPVLA